ncbi:TIGR03086 family metal-binding protein [Krasilnikovia sp. M28-CT-15]|uniref:TIGR03086 family metal-binding protein n=1 Tax=Krasilnikovia sp. M28-CT-15 TaxID=3373540 RepID=UPI003876D5C7
MQLNAVVDKSIIEAVTLVRGVTPGMLGLPTPCADWDVRALTNHLLQVVSGLHLAGLGKPIPDSAWAQDLMSDGAWGDRFDDEGRAASAAWDAESAWDRMVTVGKMPMPASLVATMFACDLVIHGWDLARATGQPFRCDNETAEAAYQFMTDMGEQGRAMGIYASPVSIGASAPELDRALALSGRDPEWTAV